MRLIQTFLIALFLIACTTLSYGQEYQLNGSLGVGTNPADDKKLDVDGDTKLRGNAEVEGELRLTSEPLRETLLDKMLYLDDNRSVTQVPSGEDLVSAFYTIPCYHDSNGELLPVWTQTPNVMKLCDGGRLGIGIDNPLSRVHVNGSLLLDFDGETGTDMIQIRSGNNTVFKVNKNGYQETILRGGEPDFWNAKNSSGEDVYKFRSNGSLKILLEPEAPSALEVIASDGATELFIMNNDGFFYAHEVHTEKVVVELDPFPDYVFEKDYNLMPLHELKKFITTNKHLPNMPTAKNVADNGADLGELNRLLVEKVEELTLYVLGLQEQIDALKERPQNSSK